MSRDCYSSDRIHLSCVIFCTLVPVPPPPSSRVFFLWMKSKRVFVSYVYPLNDKKNPNSFYRTDTPLRLGGEWVRLYFLLLNLLPFKTGHFSLLDTNLHKKKSSFFLFHLVFSSSSSVLSPRSSVCFFFLFFFGVSFPVSTSPSIQRIIFNF